MTRSVIRPRRGGTTPWRGGTTTRDGPASTWHRRRSTFPPPGARHDRVAQDMHGEWTSREGLGEAPLRVVVAREELDVVASLLQGEGGIDDEALGSACVYGRACMAAKGGRNRVGVWGGRSQSGQLSGVERGRGSPCPA